MLPDCPPSLWALARFDFFRFCTVMLEWSPADIRDTVPRMIYTEVYNKVRELLEEAIDDFLEMCDIPRMKAYRKKVLMNFMQSAYQMNIDYDNVLKHLSVFMTSFRVPKERGISFVTKRQWKAVKLIDTVMRLKQPFRTAINLETSVAKITIDKFSQLDSAGTHGRSVNTVSCVFYDDIWTSHYNSQRMWDALKHIYDVCANYDYNMEKKKQYKDKYNKANFVKKKFMKDKTIYNYQKINHKEVDYITKALDSMIRDLEHHVKNKDVKQEYVDQINAIIETFENGDKLIRSLEYMCKVEFNKIIQAINDTKWIMQNMMQIYTFRELDDYIKQLNKLTPFSLAFVNTDEVRRFQTKMAL